MKLGVARFADPSLDGRPAPRHVMARLLGAPAARREATQA